MPVTTVPKVAEWLAALAELATALDTGRVCDRDLPSLAQALPRSPMLLTGVRDGDSERGDDRARRVKHERTFVEADP